MIFDKIENSGLYENIDSKIKKAFDYIKKTDFNKLELGKHVIDEENVFAILMEYETKNASDCKLEVHKKYIDVQYVISGNENIGHIPLTTQIPSKVYDDKDDYALYDNVCSLIKVEPRQFAIFYPSDLHMPGVKTDAIMKVKKVVVKVRV